jgi:protein-tyrosine phosphatase
MPPVVIDLRNAEDLRDVVHRAVQALAEGELVALPTETVYGLAAVALDEDAVGRLLEAKGRPDGKPLTLALKSADEARDYVPDMCPLARRLARRCWPGPVTLVMPDKHPESLVRHLPPKVRQAVSPEDSVGLRVPGHPVVLEVLRMLAGPLALTSANRNGKQEAAEPRAIVEEFGEALGLVIDDGPCRFGQPSSVVRVADHRWEMLRVGVVPQRTLARLSSLMVLFVCTGNTCRSPMAEMLCRDMLARRLKCRIDELEDRGVVVMSAGLAGMLGGTAAREAIEAVAELGLDLSGHGTQPLTEPLVRHADVIYAMTRPHRDAIVEQWPSAAERTELLSADGSDICDPIGGPIERYRHCLARMQAELKIRLNELELPCVSP